MPAEEVKSQYFKNLDAIRFVAAMMVLLGHTVRPVYHHLQLENQFLFSVLQTICNGEIGVSVFFVLSGFLITHLLLHEWRKNGEVSLKNFYVRRVLRIWPLYFAVVFFSFGVYPILKTLLGVNNPLASSLGYHLLFLSNFDVLHIHEFFPGEDALSQNITWSVSIEEQFYLFWPLIFVFLPGKGWLPAILAVTAISVAFRIISHDNSSVLYFHTLAVLVDLSVGGLAAYLAFRYDTVRNYFRTSGTARHAVFISVSVLLIFFAPDLYRIPFMEATIRVAFAVAFSLFISAQAFSEKTSVLGLSRWRFASAWGKYTYGIYLLHPIVLTLTQAALRTVSAGSSTFLFLTVTALLTMAGTFVLSRISYKYFESKFLSLKRKYSSLEPVAEKEYGRF